MSTTKFMIFPSRADGFMMVPVSGMHAGPGLCRSEAEESSLPLLFPTSPPRSPSVAPAALDSARTLLLPLSCATWLTLLLGFGLPPVFWNSFWPLSCLLPKCSHRHCLQWKSGHVAHHLPFLPTWNLHCFSGKKTEILSIVQGGTQSSFKQLFQPLSHHVPFYSALSHISLSWFFQGTMFPQGLCTCYFYCLESSFLLCPSVCIPLSTQEPLVLPSNPSTCIYYLFPCRTTLCPAMGHRVGPCPKDHVSPVHLIISVTCYSGSEFINSGTTLKRPQMHHQILSAWSGGCSEHYKDVWHKWIEL